MHRTAFFLVLSSLTWALVAPKADAELIDVGVASIDITPDHPIRLSGYASRKTESQGVESRLKAKALAFGGDAEGAALLMSVDSIGVPATITDELASRLQKRAKIARERLVVAATHTHCAPTLDNSVPFLFGAPLAADQAARIDQYARALTDRLEQLALAALADRKPAHLAWATGSVGFAANRRVLKAGKWVDFGVNTDGPRDHSLPALRVTDPTGALRAVLVGYACHCTTLGGDFNKICGDWAGYACDEIERARPGATALVVIGCGADANPEPRRNVDDAKRHGTAIASEVERLLADRWKPLAGPINASFRRIDLPFGPIPAREHFAAMAGRPGADGYFGRTVLETLDRGESLPRTLSYPVQTWCFDDALAMVILGGEVVVDYAIRLKRECDAERLWVVSYANEMPCYIASKRLMAEGGYEVDSSMVYYGRPTRLAPEAEDRIVEAVHDLLPDDFDGQPPQSSQNRQVKPQAKALQGVVVDETGQPLEGADVFFLTFVTGKQVEVATQSDDEGRFGLAAPDEVEGGTEWPAGVLWAIARGRRSTHQRLFWKPAEPHPESLRLVLPPPAETMVKVVGPDDQPLVGAQITVPTVSDPDGSNAPVPKRVAELTTVTTDGAGMAMLTSIGPDEVSAVEVTTPELGVQTQYLQRSAPGTERNVTIKLRRVGRIQGRIEAPDRALVEGVGVYVVSYPFEQPPPADFTLGSASVVSDADGKFEVPALAEGKLMHIFASAPLDQAFLSVPPENVSLVAGKTAELTIPLRPAVRVRGVVREKASGKPLVGVAVGLLDGHGGSAGVPTSVDGRFEFLHLPGQVRMYLFFGKPRELPGWFRQQILTLRVGEKELEFPAIELAVAQGRVVDGAGNAVAGARIAKAVYKHESPDSRTDEVPVMWNSDPRELVTGADGRYRAWVDAGGTYRAEIKLDASVPQWTEWTDFRQVDPPEFPDVVFDSLQSVAGRVLDRQGRPVAGTRVFQSGDGPVRTEIKCDAEGRFVLAGYRAGPGYIFAEMDGYRFHGQPVVAGATEVELVLTKASEPPARRLATLPPLLTADEERALARRVSPSAQMERGNEQEKVRLLQELAKTAPADALDGIEKAGLKGMSANIVRVEVVKRWAVEHPDDALAVIEAIDDPYARAFGYAEAAGLLGAPQRERKLQWLAEAQLQLKSVQDPAMRLALTAHVADLLFESGATDDAVRLAVDCKREAEKLPDNGFAAYTRGTVAEALAHSDLPAALELIKELKDAGEFDRHHGNIARRLAAVNPLESQRVLGMVRDQFQRDQHAVRVAYSMAPAALSRARIVAETINDRDLRAYAYGLMTQALAADGGPVAAKMLDDAFRRLADLAAGDESEHIWGFHVAPVLAAALLPTVESLAPERLDEFFWRSLSLRLPLLKQGPRELTVVMSRAYLAMFLARYDRQTARGLFGDLPDHASRALQGYELDNARRTLYAAAVLVDPQWGIEQLERLPDADRDRARESVVQVLSRQGEARWQAAQELLRLWVPWDRQE